MNLTQILSERISMIVVGMQRRTLENAVMTMVTTAKIETVITSGIKSGISAAETAATFGALAETICRIAEVTPRKEWTIKRGAQMMRGTRRAVKTRRKDAANPLQPHPAWERSTNCERTQVDDDNNTSICTFLNTAPAPNEADRADDRLYLPPLSLTLCVTLAYLAYMSMFCLTQTISISSVASIGGY